MVQGTIPTLMLLVSRIRERHRLATEQGYLARNFFDQTFWREVCKHWSHSGKARANYSHGSLYLCPIQRGRNIV